MNIATIAGVVAAPPEKHHNIYGITNITALWVDIPRDSGIKDRILILSNEEKVNTFAVGDHIEAGGRLETYSSRANGKRHTQAFIYADCIYKRPNGGNVKNSILISGVIARTPTQRKTPKGRRITQTTLRTQAMNEDYNNYIICIAWEKLGDRLLHVLQGTPLTIEGRLQSRDYKKIVDGVEQTKTTWELSASIISRDDSNGTIRAIHFF